MNQPVEQRCPIDAGGYIIGSELSSLGDVDGFVQPDGVYKRLVTDKLGAVRLQQPGGRPAIPFHVVALPKLSPCQAAVLNFMILGLLEDHRIPVYADIMVHLDINSTNGVHDHLKALERKTYIARHPIADGARKTFVRILRHPDGRRFELRAE